ncbi:PepSY-associated TM helix domain-containing protein [Shewanella submarina]|uniref:PepSY-associated TM helix domain-containing protein n=1 Tax=Shewanella submarina TaxID=2016376 RepID=A0ABV7G9K4_9GAMM|nr:PepSY-associated TM helix domain-containing protein [Shewanella submarina]MCL1039315.1 PepSY-associated TM helix domain-containing protein [Shewanella submarina]
MTKAKVNWFRLNRSLHRDIGYFCIGMTLIFAISGIAVNHNDDWNPDYSVELSQLQLAPRDWLALSDRELSQTLIEQVPDAAGVKATHWSHPGEFKVFLQDASNLTLDLTRHSLEVEKISKRPLLNEFNRLHLNETHKAWVIFSDLYAGMLIFLAISALFMVKGRHSPWRKRGLLVLAGIALPAGFILW